MSKAMIARKTVQMIVGISTSAVVGQIVKNNTNPKNLLEKTEMVIGAMALGAVASNLAEDAMMKIWDDTAQAFQAKS
jgi:hypothetical protein